MTKEQKHQGTLQLHIMPHSQFDQSDDAERLHDTEVSEQPKRPCNWIRIIKSNALAVAIMFGVLMGFGIGVGLNSMEPKLTKVELSYLQFPGDLFIQLMKMLIIPIVVSSLLCSVAEIDIRSSGKIGLRALVYYISTMVLASLSAIALSLTIRPGERTNNGISSKGTESLNSGVGLALMDLFRNMVPDNLIEACFLSKKTSLYTTTNLSLPNSTDSEVVTETTIQEESILRTKKVDGMNTVGLVVASIAFGLVTSAAGAEAKPFLDFFVALRLVTFRLVAVFIWFAPVGVCFLIASKLAEIDDPAQILKDLALYIACAISSCICHGLVLSLLYLVIVRKNPLRFLSGMFPALIFAFGSASSAATLPLTIKCLEERNGVDPRVTKLIASVGATINMDGTCIMFNVIGIFVAQLNGIALDAGHVATLCLVSLSIAVGAASVPSPGSSYTIIFLTSVGLPLHDFGTILAMTWLTERVETAFNVLGDAYGAGIIEHLSGKELHNKRLRHTEIVPFNPASGCETDTTVPLNVTEKEMINELP